MFFNSQSQPEQQHIVKALRFELGKVETLAVRERMVGMLAHVDKSLASQVAEGLGLTVPTIEGPLNLSTPADANVRQFQPKPVKRPVVISPALSMANTVKDSIQTRKIAFLVADGVDAAALAEMKQALTAEGAMVKLVAPRLGDLHTSKGTMLKIDFSLFTTSSVLFDAVYVPGGAQSVQTLLGEAKAIHFVNEAYLHCKAIAASGAGIDLLRASSWGADLNSETNGSAKSQIVPPGVVLGDNGQTSRTATNFIAAIAEHRHWSRELGAQVPA